MASQHSEESKRINTFIFAGTSYIPISSYLYTVIDEEKKTERYWHTKLK